ncbi:MAG: hypothetical protein MK082_08740 [Phycisphaerales bacterium]|nr:hypothetical protein [Phycisphaerales bacterium]
MNKASLIASAAAATLAGAAFADFTGFSGVASQYNDGITNWQVIDMYANFNTDGTEAVLNVYNAEIGTSDGLGFNHNDLADAQGGSWKPSFSFEVPGVYDPMRDSYVDIGYGVGAAAALNQTALDPNFGTGLGANIPSGAGWFNLTPDNPRYANGGSLHIGHFVWDSSRSDGNELNFFTFTADIGYNEGPGSEVSFGSGSYTWDIPAPGALALLGLGGIVARRRRA